MTPERIPSLKRVVIVTARGRSHVMVTFICSVASWLCRVTTGTLERSCAGALGLVAPLRALLRQAPRPEYVAQGRVALAVCRRVAVQSVSSGAASKD